jgi:D-aminopeptidase
MIIVATDAPLDYRNLRRLASRSLYGMARTGGYGSNGSGDYAIAFSTNEGSRIRRGSQQPVVERPVLENGAMSPLLLAAAEATEEAIVDSLFTATTIEGFRGVAPALPVDKVLELAGLPVDESPD